MNLLLNNIKNLAVGNITSGEPDAMTVAAAEHYRDLQRISTIGLWLIALLLAIVAVVFALRRIAPKFRARNRVETTIKAFLIISSTIAIFTTAGIVLSVLFEAARFFQQVPFTDFLFGLKWSPQTAIRADQAGSSGAFGAISVVRRHVADFIHRDAGGGSHRFVLSPISVGIRQPQIPHHRQALAGDTGWGTDGGFTASSPR